VKRRRSIASMYEKGLSGIDDIILPRERAYARSSWHIYFIRLRDPGRRKKIFERLTSSGIGAQVHYIPVHLQPYYRRAFGYREGALPRAEAYYGSAITIPLSPRMRPADVNYVIARIKDVFRHA